MINSNKGQQIDSPHAQGENSFSRVMIKHLYKTRDSPSNGDNLDTGICFRCYSIALAP